MSLITPIAAANPAKQDGGRGGIRTHGGFPHARFRVECLKPDSATLPQWQEKTSNAQRRTSNLECNSVRHGRLALDVSSVRRNTTSVFSTTMGAAWGDMRCAPASPKMLQFLTCHALGRGCILCVQPDSHAITCCLLLTGIHRLLAPLFTSIRILFVTLTPPHRHDSTKTRNSARVT